LEVIVLDKFVTYVGGVLGGYALVVAPVGGTLLSSLDPLLDILGAASMIIFAGALVVRGVRSMFSK
jgi:hypothetical protein